MKKIIGVCCTLIISISSLNAQIEVNTSGNVGIGASPSSFYKLYTHGSGVLISGVGSGSPLIVDANYTYEPGVMINGYSYCGYLLKVNGNALATGNWISSDVQLKKNIHDLNGIEMIDKIMSLNGKSYEFKSKEELEEVYRKNNVDSVSQVPDFSDGMQYGFIAQEVENIFPELVNTDSITNLKAINYDGMIPILLQAIKKQQVFIKDLQSDIQELKNNSGGSTLKSATISDNATDIQDKTISQTNALYQNSPNPFSENTTIRYFLSEETNDAHIIINDMTGLQLKSIPLKEFGESSVEISAGELEAGMYLYSLIVDRKLFDTKQMILIDK